MRLYREKLEGVEELSSTKKASLAARQDQQLHLLCVSY
jgi:hypothetical protein